MDVSALHVHGEPVPAEEAFKADYQSFPIGGSWGPPGTPPGSISSARFQRVGSAIRWPWDSASGTPAPPASAPSPWCGGMVDRYRGYRPITGNILITPDAIGGETVDLFVEAAANPPSPFDVNPWPLLLPEPDGTPLFTLRQADIHVRDPAFEDFWHNFRVVVEMLAEFPDDGPHFARLCAGLERACNLLQLPDISDSWQLAQPILEELLSERAAPTAHSMSMVGHAHLDTAWLWPLRETVRKCARTFSTVLELMDRYPEFRFAVSQAQHLCWMRDQYPDLWDRMKARIAEGRLEPTGSMWVEADCNIPSGESLVRQIVYGRSSIVRS